MRKTLLTLFAAMFVVMFISAGAFAADKTKMTGKVKSIDAAKGEIVFCPSGTKEDITMKVDPKMIEQKKIKAGNVVNIVVEKEGSNVVKKISKSASIPVGC